MTLAIIFQSENMSLETRVNETKEKKAEAESDQMIA